MKRNIMIALTVTIFLFLLSGCGGSKILSEDEIVAQIEQDKIVSYVERAEVEMRTYKYSPDGQRFLWPTDDYVAIDSGNIQTLEITGFSIEKRQTNTSDKQDIVYCTVTMENENMRRTADYVIYLRYYDQGGWLIDSISPTSGVKYTPLSGPSVELITKIEEFHNQSRELDAYKMSSIEVSVNKSSISTMTAQVEYNCAGYSPIVEYIATIDAEYELDSASGIWRCQEFRTIGTSFSCSEDILGTYYNSDYSGKIYGTITIHSLDGNRIIASKEDAYGGTIYEREAIELTIEQDLSTITAKSGSWYFRFYAQGGINDRNSSTGYYKN